MTGYNMVGALGRIRAAEGDFIYVPDKILEGSHPVIHNHGANTPMALGINSSWAEGLLAARLASEGILVLGGDFGGNTFGNNLSQTVVDQVLAHADTYDGVDVSKAHFVGASMGNATSVRYAAQNPAKAASVMGLIPYSDPEAVRTSNRLGLKSTIEAAWGIGALDPLPEQALLKETQAPLMNVNNIPYLAYYAGDDTAALPAEVIALADLIGGQAINVGNLGHTTAAIYGAALYGGGKAWDHYIEWSGVLNV